MVIPTITVTQTQRVKSIAERVFALTRKQVLVGIPAEKSSRPGETGKINNAELLYIHTHGVRKKAMRDEMQRNIDSGMQYSEAHSLYIHEHGSPLWAIPPRPVLEPAIKANREPIANQLQLAYQAAIEGNAQEADRRLQMAGMLAENFAKAWFEDPRNHWKPNAPSTIARKGSALPLVDTNEMRKSITHVVRQI